MATRRTPARGAIGAERVAGVSLQGTATIGLPVRTRLCVMARTVLDRIITLLDIMVAAIVAVAEAVSSTRLTDAM